MADLELYGVQPAAWTVPKLADWLDAHGATPFASYSGEIFKTHPDTDEPEIYKIHFPTAPGLMMARHVYRWADGAGQAKQRRCICPPPPRPRGAAPSCSCGAFAEEQRRRGLVWNDPLGLWERPRH